MTDRLAVPVRFVPVCVICRLTVPGPEESVAVPRHEPAMLSTVAEGAAGVDSDEFLQATVNVRTSSGRNSGRVARRIGYTDDTSVSDRETVLSHVGSAHHHPGRAIELDALITAESADALRHRVAAPRQLRADIERHGALDHQAVRGVVDSRRLASFLHIHPEVDDVHEHLCVPLRLVIAAHDAK